MNLNSLSKDEKIYLLRLARESIVRVVKEQPALILNLEDYSARLREDGASFVTLTHKGELRGCIGTLEAYQPLVQDVCEHAQAAAVEDYRFSPVRSAEIPHLEIEISVLTAPQPLDYQSSDDLVKLLRPNVDGVILRDGIRRATFLPQVWEKLPDPQKFLSHLCWKMGSDADLWRFKKLEVLIYQVEEFSEKDFPDLR